MRRHGSSQFESVLPCGQVFPMPLRFAGFILLIVALGPPSPAQSPPNIAGVWVLNPALTQRPPEIGFNPGWARSEPGASGEEGGEGSRGGRGRRGGAARPPQVVRESADDSTRATQLTEEA